MGSGHDPHSEPVQPLRSARPLWQSTTRRRGGSVGTGRMKKIILSMGWDELTRGQKSKKAKKLKSSYRDNSDLRVQLHFVLRQQRTVEFGIDAMSRMRK